MPKLMRNKLTAHRLREVLHYEPMTGIFTWLISRGNAAKGKRAGATNNDNGYITIAVDCVRYLAHRLAWLYQTGIWPDDLIDHRDLDGSNNSWNNLRSATNSQNCCNKTCRSDNKLQLKGVSLLPSGRWRATIYANGKQKHLGVFQTKYDAHAAYTKSAAEFHGEFGRGK